MSFAIIWKAVPLWLKYGVLCALLVFGAYWAGEWNGARLERQAAETRTLQKTFDQLKERSRTNEEVRNLSDAALCAAIGGRLSDDGVCE